MNVHPQAIANLGRIGEMTWHCEHCAGCNHKFREHERPYSRGFLSEPEGIALYVLCAVCSLRIQRDRKFRRRVQRDAYRSLFGAGPDDVRGDA